MSNSFYPKIEKAMSYAGLLALLGNLANTVKNGDLETLKTEMLGVFLFQQIVKFVVNFNYNSKENPTVWFASCVSSIVAGNVILFLMYLKVHGYGTCFKVRTCTESNDATGPNLIKLPGHKELLYLAVLVSLQLIAFNVFFG